jgi:hypothetical protein
MDFQDLAAESMQTLGPNGYYEATRKTRVALGYDPAQSFDESALVLVESVREPIQVLQGDPLKAVDWRTLRQRLGPQQLYVRKIRRLPKHTPYPQQVEMVRTMIDNAARIGKRAELVIDITGVGLPIAQMMPASNLYPTRILITSGNEVTRANGDWRVPKKVLVGLLDSHLNNGELALPGLSKYGNTADDLEIKELKKQMQSFVAGYSANGSATYAASGQGKDDLVLALSYAVFALSERRGRSRYSVTDLAKVL